MAILYAVIVILAAAVGVLIFYIRRENARKLELIQMLIGVTEVGDPGLDGHSLNVLYLTRLLYDFLPENLRSRVDREKLSYAALLLDLGKLGIPVDIRNKSGKLTDEEWKLVRKHPELGVYYLKKVPGMEKIAEWVLYHHERVDGDGYHGLKGEEIPLASRIIAVADTFSAITMERSYRPSLPYEEAVTELKLAAGSQLDAELVRCFCEIPPKRVVECMKGVQDVMREYSHERISEN